MVSTIDGEKSVQGSTGGPGMGIGSLPLQPRGISEPPTLGVDGVHNPLGFALDAILPCEVDRESIVLPKDDLELGTPLLCEFERRKKELIAILAPMRCDIVGR